MPQLWLTYQELGDALGCAPTQARQTAIGEAWIRKHSSDGNTRVMLPTDMMRSYFEQQAFAAPRAYRPHLVEPSRKGLLSGSAGRG